MRAAAVLVVALVTVGACRPGGTGLGASGVVAEAAAYRFPHAAPTHRGLACTDCHDAAAIRAGRPARPGADDHAPCDRSGCHAEAFAVEPGRLCTLCHRVVVPWLPGRTVPAPWPPTTGPQVLGARFSHATHLDRAAMDAAVGFNVSCGDCHVRAEGALDPAEPGHAACARCHAASPAGARRGARPTLDDCAACHTSGAQPRGRALIRGDLRFSHAKHDQDRTGRAIPCVTCHRDVDRLERRGARSLPPLAVCVACHDDPARTPANFKMSACGTCHDSPASTLESFVAPRSHLPPRDRPDDHTLAFRRDHGPEARRDARRCATCHTMMSGSRRDACDDCHQAMKPEDHGLPWREFEHGPEAALSAERCATCHVGEFCTACHSRPPRSHYPLAVFRQGEGHRDEARWNTRACATCHEPARDCTGLGCHATGGAGP